MPSLLKKPIALPLSVAVFYADVSAASAAALLQGTAGWELGLPLMAAAPIALAVGVCVWWIFRALLNSRLRARLEELAMRIDNWAEPPVVTSAVVHELVDHLAWCSQRTTVSSGPAPGRESKSTEPRQLEWYELLSWKCPYCEQTPTEGTHAWDDRGPFQLLSNHTFVCPDGHRWSNSTDGG